MGAADRRARAVYRIAGSAGFARVAPHVVPPLDRALHRLSGGRFLLSQRLVPSIVLHARGARTGQERDTPLACAIDGDAFLVVGSNFGRERHPAWTANLLADPEAAVTHHGARTEVTARLLDGDEKAAVWPRLLAVWPVYDRYAERSGRDLRVFRLEPRRLP